MQRKFQSSILTPTTDYASFLIVHLHPTTKQNQVGAIRNCLQRFHQLVEECVNDLTRGQWEEVKDAPPLIQAAIGISVDFVQLIGDRFPRFPSGLDGQFGSMKNTGGDLFVHVKSERLDACFEVSNRFVSMLKASGVVIIHLDHTLAFLYKKNQFYKNGMGRDLSQFEDGTENPEHEEKAGVLSSDKLIEGACFACTQKWQHHKLEWFQNELSVKQQEEVIGRTRDKSEEYPDEEKLPTSHIARVVVTDEKGEELEIVRQSMTYGDVNTKGIFFLAFTADLNIISRMLLRMVGKDNVPSDEAHLNDHLMQFSQAVTGQYWYIPSMKELQMGEFVNLDHAILRSRL